MKTINKVDEAIKWLESEYPKGCELIYVDYRDSFEDAGQLQEVLKSEDSYDPDWYWEAQADSIEYILREYREQNGLIWEDMTDEVREVMIDWLHDHDTSNPLKQLLKNTGSQLCYIETPDTIESYTDEPEASDRQRKYLHKKYGQNNDAQKKEIDYILNEQFYSAPASFYFYADVEDLYNALISGKKYITIQNAYFADVDRIQGSNWIGNKGIFDLVVPLSVFKENFYLDKAKGTGYSWNEIAGMTGYDDAVVGAGDKKPAGYIALMDAETSEAQKREQRLQAQWDKTHKCRAGDFDMNWNRHSGEKPYSNNYPCGNKCTECGTFWID